MLLKEITLSLKTLPERPGVYQFFDKDKQLLYVGKAKNLKKRVNSYFSKTHDSKRIEVMVKKISSIKHIIVDSEDDALLLENNLIKSRKPRFNIMLRDDKTYPWLCIKKERFPRIFLTRKIIKDGSEYFGPFPSLKGVKTLLDLIKNLYTLRTCNYDLSENKIEAKKYKVCLEFHLGNCKGPCEALQLEKDYDQQIESIREILKGNFSETLKKFKAEMKILAKQLKFEEAEKVKQKINSLKRYQAKSTVVSPKISNVDVFSIISDEEYSYINFLQVVNGAIIRSQTIEIKKKLNESDKSILELGITELRQRFKTDSTTILVPFKVDIGKTTNAIVPKMGDKKALVELSTRNAKYYRIERFKTMKILDPDRHSKRIVHQIMHDLRLPKKPVHIECFDNSNIQGTNPVAACVVFKNAKPSKKDYRKFNIKTVDGPDDFASMEEVVYRRYKRLISERQDLPQLIVIDGGKGQLSSAVKALDKLNLRNKISIIGIAKRLEEIYYPNDSYPLYLDKKSETLKIIQQLRNEAHRFGITFHRQKRSKQALDSVLEKINGIGQATAIKLLKEFRSVARIKQVNKEHLSKIIGEHKAEIIVSHFTTSDEL